MYNYDALLPFISNGASIWDLMRRFSFKTCLGKFAHKLLIRMFTNAHTKADTYTTHNNAIFDLRKSGLIFTVNFQFGFSDVTAFNKVKSVCTVILALMTLSWSHSSIIAVETLLQLGSDGSCIHENSIVTLTPKPDIKLANTVKQ